MNTKQIDCAIELAQTLNFNRAAENLFMSQPSLSYQIRVLEEEIGFRVFDRTGRGAVLTPAGAQFVATLRSIRSDLRRAIELGQNFSARYQESITVGLTWRSSLLALPDAMEKLSEVHPEANVTPIFNRDEGLGDFLRGNQDIVFARDSVRRLPEAKIYPLYRSRIYVVARKDDPLARKKRVSSLHLKDRTLMIGSEGPEALRDVQHRLAQTPGVSHFNCDDHATSLVNVAAGKGVCLAPGYLNDGSDEFAWIPFECQENISCVLLTREGERRESVLDLVGLLQEAYRGDSKFARLV